MRGEVCSAGRASAPVRSRRVRGLAVLACGLFHLTVQAAEAAGPGGAGDFAAIPDRATWAPGALTEPQAKALPGARPTAPAVLRPVSHQGLSLTKLSEGFEPRLYHDAAGYCTIGYGHLVQMARCDDRVPTELRGGLSEPQAHELLVTDMAGAQRAVSSAVQVPLSEAQYAALCDFVFNVGSGHFRRSSLLERINAGDHGQVPAQLRRWVRAGGQEHAGLRTRREREIALYLEGLDLPIAKGLPTEPPLPSIDLLQGEPDR